MVNLTILVKQDPIWVGIGQILIGTNAYKTIHDKFRPYQSIHTPYRLIQAIFQNTNWPMYWSTCRPVCTTCFEPFQVVHQTLDISMFGLI